AAFIGRARVSGFMERRGSLGQSGLAPANLTTLAHFSVFFGNELAEFEGRADKRRGSGRNARLYSWVGESRVYFLIELVDDLGRRGLRCADAEPETCFVARHKLTDSRHFG